MPERRLPPFPAPLAHIWSDFAALRATKLMGMSGQQITWAEIQAHDAAMLTSRPAWAKRLLRRLDDAYEAARPENAGARPAKTSVADMKASLRATIAARKAKAEVAARKAVG